METPFITINSYEIKSKTNIVKLSKIQKKICKWFRITPEERYSFILKVNIDANNPLYIGDNVLMADETMWHVTKVGIGCAELNNLVLLKSINIRNGDQMVVYGNSWQ